MYLSAVALLYSCSVSQLLVQTCRHPTLFCILSKLLSPSQSVLLAFLHYCTYDECNGALAVSLVSPFLVVSLSNRFCIQGQPLKRSACLASTYTCVSFLPSFPLPKAFLLLLLLLLFLLSHLIPRSSHLT